MKLNKFSLGFDHTVRRKITGDTEEEDLPYGNTLTEGNPHVTLVKIVSLMTSFIPYNEGSNSIFF